jgi:hypothetical protein
MTRDGGEAASPLALTRTSHAAGDAGDSGISRPWQVMAVDATREAPVPKRGNPRSLPPARPGDGGWDRTRPMSGRWPEPPRPPPASGRPPPPGPSAADQADADRETDAGTDRCEHEADEEELAFVHRPARHRRKRRQPDQRTQDTADQRAQETGDDLHCDERSRPDRATSRCVTNAARTSSGRERRPTILPRSSTRGEV